MSCLAWYPVDTGLFVSGDYGGFLRVWDTERFCTATQFDRKTRVHAAAMSPIATSHSVVAGTPFRVWRWPVTCSAGDVCCRGHSWV